MKKTIASILISSTMFSCASIDNNRRAQVIGGIMMVAGAGLALGSLEMSAADERYIRQRGYDGRSYNDPSENNPPLGIMAGIFSTGGLLLFMGGTVGGDIALNNKINQLRESLNGQVNFMPDRVVLVPDSFCHNREGIIYDRELYISSESCVSPDSLSLQCQNIFLCQRMRAE
jgi:hypothetical protein